MHPEPWCADVMGTPPFSECMGERQLPGGDVIGKAAATTSAKAATASGELASSTPTTTTDHHRAPPSTNNRHPRICWALAESSWKPGTPRRACRLWAAAMSLDVNDGFVAANSAAALDGDLPIFTVERVQLQFSIAADFVAAQVANNVIILALSNGRILRIDLNRPEDIDGALPRLK